MANNKNDLSMMNPNLNKKIAKQIQDNIDSIYKNTYFSDNKDNSYIDAIRRRMDKDINALTDKSRNSANGSNISSLYAKILSKSDGDALKSLQHTLQDETMLSDIMDMYSQNAILKDMDREIDVVCKYMPKLEQALDIKADHVMSADHFNQDSIEINVNTEDSSVSSNADPKYSSKKDIEAFKNKYKIFKKAREIYEKTAKYGEQFVYVTSYNKALKRLVEKTASGNLLTESGILNEEALEEAVDNSSTELEFVYRDSPIKDYDNSEYLYDLNESTSYDSIPDYTSSDSAYNDIKIEINKTGVIPSILKQESSVRRILSETNDLFTAGMGSSSSGGISNASYIKNMNAEFKKFAKQGGKLKSPTSLSMDGFIDKDKAKKNSNKIDINGAVIRILDHTMVKPLYIDETCLGYYYIETNKAIDYQEQTTFTSTLGGLRPRRAIHDKEALERKGETDEVLRKIASQISKKIDADFINANQDLAQEIYSILKYNADNGTGKVGKIRVSFIPPEDIVHCYFNLNEKTKRGKSDLSKALFPAKLYSCLYISNVIALLTRGYDKRIYHVKQSVDTNITAVLMNVINQIKQSNFNLRQIENMNNIMNITGRFNDLVIPQNQNGESPVSFEVLPGQNVEVNTEFMRSLEEMAVAQTGVTVDMVNNQLNEQTATHITMNNSRFLMKIYNRQKQYQELLSEICTKIYQAEYDTKDTIEVVLPPPAMLNFTNTSQMLASGNELIQNIVQMKMGAEMDETVRAKFNGKLMEFYFKSFLPMDDINRLEDEARIEVEADKSSDQVIASSMPQQGEQSPGGEGMEGQQNPDQGMPQM